MEILPFPGFHYNQAKVGDLLEVVSPPYDVISPAARQKYCERHPYNFVHLTLGKNLPGDNEIPNKYLRSAELLRRWIQENILLRGNLPAIYLYTLKFRYREKSFIRRGIISLVKLEEYSRGKIFPHEMTQEEPKADRLALLRACRAHLEPVFGIWFPSHNAKESFYRLFENEEKITEIKDEDGAIHSLGRITGEDYIEPLESFFRDKNIVIADGHHRYEAALEYQRQQSLAEKGFAPERYVMMYLVSQDDPGLVILPTHRLIPSCPLDFSSLIKRLEPDFQIRYFNFQNREERCQQASLFSQMVLKRPSLGMYFGNEKTYCMLIPRKPFCREGKSREWNALEAVILQELILEPIFGIKELSFGERGEKIGYTHDEAEAIQKVREGSYQIAFFLNSPEMNQIERIALQGERMPSKSTYFYPKPLSGLVFYAWG